ncbi:MAG: GerMN domain-containing protein [bacterium]|nr:GerMN domain-containing protein [bacterium]
MNGEPNGDNGGLPPLDEGRGGPLRFLRNPRVLAPLVLLTIGALAVVWWTARQASRPADLAGEIQDAPGTVVDLPRAGDRAVVLVFPRWDGDGWISEDRRVPSRGEPGEDLLALMTALCDGPGTGRAISALPRGTRALAAFVDPARGTAFVDFSRELVAGHPGGSAAETATVTSILRTVAVNFPQVGACTILVDGRQVGTLAGHVDLAHPFAPRRWL